MKYYEKLTLRNFRTNEEIDLVCDFKQLEEKLEFKKTYEKNNLNVANCSIQNNINIFIPTKLEFESVDILSTTEFEEVKKIVREQTDPLLLTIKKYNSKEISCFVSIIEDTVSQVKSTIIEKWHFILETTSDFFVLENYKYSIDGSVSIKNENFDYTFDFPMDGFGENTLSGGKIQIKNNSVNDVAYLYIEINGESTNPSWGINNSPDNTINSYKSKLSVQKNETLIVNSFPSLAQITKNNINFSLAKYNKNHISYCYLPKGITDNNIFFENVANANIYVFNIIGGI